MTYQNTVTKKAQAFCHLLLFFSLFEDESFEGEETFQVFSILKSYPLTEDVNFPDEVNVFFDYKNDITDRLSYFQYLTHIIGYEFPTLLLFHAAQVAMSDEVYSEKDHESLLLLRMALDIDKAQGNAIIDLALAERNLKLKQS